LKEQPFSSKGGSMSKIISYIVKNMALLIGIVEAVLKVAAGIVSLTPTKKDDAILEVVDRAFSAVKKILYTIADKLAGK
jgi:hypothetical protein